MAQTITLKAERRANIGTGAARQLRRQGQIPAVIYGHGREPECLAIETAELEKVLAGIAGSTVIELKTGSKKQRALIREVQRHPTRPDILHIDFLEVHAGEKLTVKSPIRLVGSPEGVRNQGGVLDQITRELEIRVLPKDMPEFVEVDVTELTVAHSVHVRDIVVPNAEILDDPEATVCTVVPPRVEIEPVAVAEEEEEELLEPELIRKAKAEEEAEETEVGGGESTEQKE
jgi:large subunit ribosomal protein L25